MSLELDFGPLIHPLSLTWLDRIFNIYIGHMDYHKKSKSGNSPHRLKIFDCCLHCVLISTAYLNASINLCQFLLMSETESGEFGFCLVPGPSGQSRKIKHSEHIQVRSGGKENGNKKRHACTRNYTCFSEIKKVKKKTKWIYERSYMHFGGEVSEK